MNGTLALPRCDKCGHRWHARYRRNKAPKFYCPHCGRVHPRWTAAEIESVKKEGARLWAKFNQLPGMGK